MWPLLHDILDILSIRAAIEEEERRKKEEERCRKRNAAIIKCIIYSAIIGVLYYYGFTDSFFEWIYNWWND